MSNIIGDIVLRPVEERLTISNDEYVQRVNQAAIQKVFQRPTTTVVLAQDPPAGTPVPLGTQVNLTIVAKEEIPIGVLGVPSLQQRYATVGDVEAGIEAGGTAVQAILDKGVEYEDLSAGDQEVFAGFIRTQYANQQAPDLKSAYGDMLFVNGL